MLTISSNPGIIWSLATPLTGGNTTGLMSCVNKFYQINFFTFHGRKVCANYWFNKVAECFIFCICRSLLVFMPPRSKIGGHIVFVLSVILSFCHSVILSFCPPLWNFNLANNFWTVSARALIFHMSIPCDKTFPWIPIFFTLWPWPLS